MSVSEYYPESKPKGVVWRKMSGIVNKGEYLACEEVSIWQCNKRSQRHNRRAVFGDSSAAPMLSPGAERK